MKSRNLVLLLAMLFGSVVSFAQTSPFLQLGIKAGTNITKIEGQSFNSEFNFGYSLGAFLAIKVGEKWQIQPEVLFNQYNTKTGSNFNQINPLSSGNNNLKDVSLNYISIPVLLNYSPTRLFTLQAGPQFGILRDKNTDLITNGKNAFKNGDFSMLGGIQMNLANFKISGRYVVGLSNINDIGNNDKWKSQGFQLSLGLRII